MLAASFEAEKSVLRLANLSLQGDFGPLQEGLVSALHKIRKTNLGLARHEMPQILNKPPAQMSTEDFEAYTNAGGDPDSLDSPLVQLLDSLPRAKLVNLPVGKLKATQEEIKADKVLGIAMDYTQGTFNPGKSPILVSNDAYILDGHHRWAAMLALDPSIEVQCLVVNLPIAGLLEKAKSFPGVFFRGL